MPKRYHDLTAGAFLALLILIFLAPALAPGQVLAPLDIVAESWPPWQRPNQPVEVHNFMLTDVVNYIIPVKLFMSEAVRGGELPLWNPYVFTGYPFTYNTQAGLWYPLNWLYYLLPPATAIDLIIILQMVLGAWFMYGYLRQIALSPVSAVTGAIVFSFNGLMVVWLEWQVVHAALIWLPLQLWLIERVAQHLERPSPQLEKSLALGILTGLTFAIPWLGGHWNWTLFGSLTVVFYLLWRFWPLLRAKTPERERRTAWLLLLLIPGIGIAVSLIQVLPAFVYLSQTHRQPMSFAQTLDHSLWHSLVVMVIPKFFGTPVQNNWWEDWWGPQNFNEMTFYLGLLPLLLAGLTLTLRRDRWTLFFSIWGTLGLLWIIRSPVYWLLHLLPVFNGLFPSRGIMLVVVSVSVLAAVSMDRLMQPGAPPEKKRPFLLLALLFLALIGLVSLYFWFWRTDVGRTWEYLRPQTITAATLLIVSFVLLLARLSNRLAARPFVLLALLLIVLDLFHFGRDYNTIGTMDQWFGETAVADFLHADSTTYRIVTPAESIVYWPNTSLVDAIANVSGYEPGVWQRTTDYLSLAEGEKAIHFDRVLMPLRGLNSPLLDAINARYLVTTENRWGSEPAPGPTQQTISQWLPLSSGEAISLNLPLPNAGFYRLELPLQVEDGVVGVVTARVFTADEVLELANSSVETTAVVSEAPTTFYFSAMPSEWGRDFAVRIEFQGEGGHLLLATDNAGNVAFSTWYLPRPDLAFEEGKSQIYRNPRAFERAYFVPQAVVVANFEEAQTAVLHHANELDQIVVLEAMGHPLPPDLGSTGQVEAQVIITHYGLNRVEVRVINERAGFLVLSDTYYPGWRATVNRQATPLYQANSLVRAIYLPAGEHNVVFSFWPPDFIFGAIISSLTLLVSLVALLVMSQRQRQKNGRFPTPI
jgi:hypothetical protein